MNTPNKLTLFRIILTFVFIPFVLLEYFIPAVAIFLIASITDFLDGYIARKYKLITNLGKFLDPLADKILVISALVCFVELGFAPSFAVCIIIMREFMVTGLRLAAASSEIKVSAENKVIAAGLLGKIKTASTMATIIIILCLHILEGFTSITPLDINLISHILIYISLATTVLSGADYFIKYRKFLK